MSDDVTHHYYIVLSYFSASKMIFWTFIELKRSYASTALESGIIFCVMNLYHALAAVVHVWGTSEKLTQVCPGFS